MDNFLGIFLWRKTQMIERPQQPEEENNSETSWKCLAFAARHSIVPLITHGPATFKAALFRSLFWTRRYVHSSTPCIASSSELRPFDYHKLSTSIPTPTTITCTFACALSIIVFPSLPSCSARCPSSSPFSTSSKSCNTAILLISATFV